MIAAESLSQSAPSPARQGPAGRGPAGQAPLPPQARAGRTLTDLAAIRRRGVNLALWIRSLPPPVAAAVAELAASEIAPIRLTGEPAAIVSALGRHLPAGGVLPWLTEDVGALAGMFAKLARIAEVTLRLEAITGDACRFFHADRISLRLVTTYHGRGTQWLADADTGQLGPGRPVPEDRVRDIAPGHVAVFRGAGPEGTAPHPLVHRSPPARPGDGPRLFLAIDPA